MQPWNLPLKENSFKIRFGGCWVATASYIACDYWCCISHDIHSRMNIYFHSVSQIMKSWWVKYVTLSIVSTKSLGRMVLNYCWKSSMSSRALELYFQVLITWPCSSTAGRMTESCVGHSNIMAGCLSRQNEVKLFMIIVMISIFLLLLNMVFTICYYSFISNMEVGVFVVKRIKYVILK